MSLSNTAKNWHLPSHRPSGLRQNAFDNNRFLHGEFGFGLVTLKPGCLQCFGPKISLRGSGYELLLFLKLLAVGNEDFNNWAAFVSVSVKCEGEKRIGQRPAPKNFSHSQKDLLQKSSRDPMTYLCVFSGVSVSIHSTWSVLHSNEYWHHQAHWPSIRKQIT